MLEADAKIDELIDRADALRDQAGAKFAEYDSTLAILSMWKLKVEAKVDE